MKGSFYDKDRVSIQQIIFSPEEWLYIVGRHRIKKGSESVTSFDPRLFQFLFLSTDYVDQSHLSLSTINCTLINGAGIEQVLKNS